MSAVEVDQFNNVEYVPRGVRLQDPLAHAAFSWASLRLAE